MPKTDDELAAIVADPEFAKFSEAERARIVRDARRAKAPLMTPQAADPVRPRARSVMERAPAPSPLAPYLAPAPRPVARTQAQPAASMLDEFRAMAPEFPGETAADRAARDARLSRPITNPLQRAVRSAREVLPQEAEEGLSSSMVAGAYRDSKPADAPLVRVPQPVAKPLASMAAQNPEPWLTHLPVPATAPALRAGAPRPMPADPRLAPKTAADLPDPGAFGRWVDAHTDVLDENVVGRLHPMAAGFAEGLGAGAVNMGVNAFDPAGDMLGAGALSAAGMAARRLAGPPPVPSLPVVFNEPGVLPRPVDRGEFPGAAPAGIDAALAIGTKPRPRTLDPHFAPTGKAPSLAMRGLTPPEVADPTAAKLLADFRGALDAGDTAGANKVANRLERMVDSNMANMRPREQLRDLDAAWEHMSDVLNAKVPATRQAPGVRGPAGDATPGLGGLRGPQIASPEAPALGLAGLVPKARPGAIFPKRIPASAENPEVLPPIKQLGAAPPTGRIIGEPEQLHDGRLIVRAEFEGQRVAINLMHPNGTAKTMDEVMAEIPREAAIVKAGWEAADAGLTKNIETMKAGGKPTTMNEQIRGIKNVWRDAGDKYDGLAPAIDAEQMPVPRRLPAEPARLTPGQPALDTPWYQPKARPGSIFPERAQKLNAQIARLQATREEALRLGNQPEADRIEQEILSLRDYRTTTGDPQPPASSTMNPGRYINRGKWNLTPGGMERLEANVARAIHENGLDPKAVITWQEIKDGATAMTGEAVDDLKFKAGTLTSVEYKAAHEAAQEMVEEASRLEVQLNPPPGSSAAVLTPEQQADIRQQIMALDKDSRDLLAVLMPSRSQKGRDLNYLKMIARQGFGIDYWTARATRLTGGALSEAEYARIRSAVAAGLEAENTGNQAGAIAARRELAQVMARLERSPFATFVSSLGKANMLTGVGTFTMNFLGPPSVILADGIAKTAAIPFDRAIGRWNKNKPANPVRGHSSRAITVRPGQVWAAAKVGAKKGAQQAREIWRHGMTIDQMDKLDVRRELHADIPGLRWTIPGTNVTPNRLLDGYANHVFRALSMPDRLFHAYGVDMSIREQAKTIAMNEAKAHLGLDVNTRAAHIYDEVVNGPQTVDSAAITAQAMLDAASTTLTNETVLGELLKGLTGGYLSQAPNPAIKKMRPGVEALADTIIPLKQIPAAGAQRTLDFSGIGQGFRTGQAILSGDAGRMLREGLTREEQRAVSLALGRGATGLAVVLTGMYYGSRGLITPVYDPEMKETTDAAGRVPGSVKLGGRWVPLGALPPFGPLLAVGATLGRPTLDAPKAAGAVLRAVTENPMTQGIKQAEEFMADPERGGAKIVASVAGRTVPAMLGDVAVVADGRGGQPATPPGLAAAAAGIQSKIPGLRNQMPIRPDAFGQDAEGRSGWTGLWRFIGKEAREDNDPGLRALLRLGVPLPRMAKDVPIGGVDVPLTFDEQLALRRAEGEATRTAIGYAAGGLEGLERVAQREYLKSQIGLAINGRGRPGQKNYLPGARDVWIAQNIDALMARITEAERTANMRHDRRGMAVQEPTTLAPAGVSP